MKKALKISFICVLFFSMMPSVCSFAQSLGEGMEYYYNPRTGQKAVKVKAYKDTTVSDKRDTIMVELVGEVAEPEQDSIVGRYDSTYYDYEYASRINRFHRGVGFSYWMWDPYWDFYYGWGPYMGYCPFWYDSYDYWCWGFCYDYHYVPAYHYHGYEAGFSDRGRAVGHSNLSSAGPVTQRAATASGKRLTKPSHITESRQALTSGRTTADRTGYAHNGQAATTASSRSTSGYNSYTSGGGVRSSATTASARGTSATGGRSTVSAPSTSSSRSSYGSPTTSRSTFRSSPSSISTSSSSRSSFSGSSSSHSSSSSSRSSSSGFSHSSSSHSISGSRR